MRFNYTVWFDLVGSSLRLKFFLQVRTESKKQLRKTTKSNIFDCNRTFFSWIGKWMIVEWNAAHSSREHKKKVKKCRCLKTSSCETHSTFFSLVLYSSAQIKCKHNLCKSFDGSHNKSFNKDLHKNPWHTERKRESSDISQ